MHSFTDKAGRAYNLDITVAALKRVRDLAGFDLCQIGAGAETRLDDLAVLGEILYVLATGQKPAGPEAEAFLTALDGPAMARAAAAFWAELAGFFRPCLPLAGSLIAAAAEAARRTREEMAAASTSGGASTGSPEPPASIPTP